jgi:hypothetical protein
VLDSADIVRDACLQKLPRTHLRLDAREKPPERHRAGRSELVDSRRYFTAATVNCEAATCAFTFCNDWRVVRSSDFRSRISRCCCLTASINDSPFAASGSYSRQLKAEGNRSRLPQTQGSSLLLTTPYSLINVTSIPNAVPLEITMSGRLSPFRSATAI